MKELTPYCEISEDGRVSGMTVPVHKPIDWTSFDVVKKCRIETGFKKVGHAGTLDPFAEGVLILGFGRHTKKLDRYMHKDKVYRVDIRLGQRTDTLDRTGRVIDGAGSDSPPGPEQIRETLTRFTGSITQIPPMYSAKKVKGERLYKLARAGRIIERDPVEVRIDRIDVLRYAWPLLTCRVYCSTGTYIRSLADDIGRALGTGAYAQALLRERIGDTDLDECFTLDEFIAAWRSITT